MENKKRKVSETTFGGSGCDALLTKLIHTKASDTLAHGRRPIYTVKTTDTLPVAFKLIVRNNILSLPVMNTKGSFFGYIDMLDILHHTVKLFGKDTLDKLTGSSYETIEELFRKEDSFQHVTVKQIIKYPYRKMNPYHPIPQDASLYYAFETIARFSVDRVPVVDHETGAIENIITQSFLIKFLVDHMDLISEDVRNRPVSTMQQIGNEITAVKASNTALVAFEWILQRKVKGCPIVDDNLQMVGNLSARDIRMIADDANLFWRIYQPVGEYIKCLEKDHSAKRPSKLVYVKKTDSLESVIRALYTNKIHHVFVAQGDDNLRPVGVVTLGDCIREILNA